MVIVSLVIIQVFYCTNTREYTNIRSCRERLVFDALRPQERIFVQTLVYCIDLYRHLHVLHLILYLTFTASLYDGKYVCFHMGVMGSISRPIRGIAMQMGASN